jgi:predicted ABC-type ATPase
MEGNGRPTLWLIAGANGVGKTTYARARIEAVSGTRSFVNLDLIALGLSPFGPEDEQIRAARVAIEMARDLIAKRQSFTIETTLSGLTHQRLVALAKANGMAVKLLYFFVDTPEQCIERVVRRVSEGGHDVPETDIRRRYARSLNNFALYARQCDFWRIYNANGLLPMTVAEGNLGATSHDNLGVLPKPLGLFLGR